MVRKKQEDKLKKQARFYNIKEGIFAYANLSFGNHFVSPFAIALNSSNSLVALLSSISGLLGPFTQTIGSKLIEKNSRKKVLNYTVILESLTWILMALIAFLFYKNILVGVLPIFALIGFSLYVIFMNIGHPAFFSWTGDLVNEKKRGRWFAKRNLIVGFVSVVSAVSASFFLDYISNKGFTMFGFMILFVLAFLLRFECWGIYRKMYEPKIKLKKIKHFSFWNFLSSINKTNFGKFSLFRTFLAFACSISSSLMAVYLLRELGFDYKIYIIIIFSATVFSLGVMELWGKFADKYGNYKVMIVTCFLIPFIPFLWVVHSSVLYLIFVPSMINGLTWAGFNLAAQNFIYDSVTPQKRGLVVSYYNLLVGFGVFFGAGLGALLIKILPTYFSNSIFAIFLLGTFVRLIVVLFGISHIKEVRKVQKVCKTSDCIKDIFIKEAKPTLMQEIHEIYSIKKYVAEK